MLHPARAAGRALAALGCLALALPCHADNPGYDRPGLGFTPAVLDPGQVTIEQGLPTWTRDTQGGMVQSQYTTDSLIRLGIGGPFEAQLGTSPFNAIHQQGQGTDAWSHGHGDTILALKYAPSKPGDFFTWGLLGSVEFTDGAQGVRSDRRQYLLGADLNWQVADADTVGTYLEDVRTAGQDQLTVALNENHQLNKSVTAYVEAAWVRLPGAGSGTEAGAGLAWMVSQRVQLDGGLRHRLGGHAQQWMASVGVSVFLGH
ncbi:transporter [Dyella soli]|uniref:Transporter n=1 Tax=Dyella soli TaxID=522319 RepID=A0A4R0YTZ9_9GAMM|nr:transporter [Dyella soli]TCI09760.1 transporter [Dyella soli]